MADIRLVKGLDIGLAGKPEPTIDVIEGVETVAMVPVEFAGVKPRLKVKEGDTVKAGTPLFINKKQERLQFCAPVAGAIEEIRYGYRRVIERIVIRVAADQPAETGPDYNEGSILSLEREALLDRLLETGFLALFKQRPFGIIPDPESRPKSIFVNAMATAPFRADPDVVSGDDPEAFRLGLAALTRLTDGPVHVVVGDRGGKTASLVGESDRVRLHAFQGPHPSGNTSIHIHHLDPILPQDVVWTIAVPELVQVGALLRTGRPAPTRVIALGGPGVRPDRRRHLRVPVGAPLSALLDGVLEKGASRIVAGDVLGGKKVAADGYLPAQVSSLTVLPEGGDRKFLGWAVPGAKAYSASRAYLSRWTGGLSRTWALDTTRNGSHRPMVVTGWYDRVLPMKILPDYLVRAVLARDTEEAIEHGILETVPEDFALCAFICPSKTDVSGIIAKGLLEIQEEGI